MKKERILKEFNYVNEYGVEQGIKLIEEYWDFTKDNKVDERTIELRIEFTLRDKCTNARFYKRKSKAIEEFENLEKLYR